MRPTVDPQVAASGPQAAPAKVLDEGRTDQIGATQMKPLIHRRRVVGVSVAALLPLLGIGVAACGGVASSDAATTASTAVTTTSTSSAKPSGAGGFAGHAAGSGSGSNARSTNAAGGSVGKVTAVSSSSFTMSTPTGTKVTVKKTSSTVYDKGTTKSTASAVSKGETVFVVGEVNSDTITASQVIVNPNINLSKATKKVIAFQQPNTSQSKKVGTIPADYTQGSGTLVSGTAATKATEAALSSYAGGVIDRVVQLSNGDYEVHNIGVSWPHHIFVSKDFKVIGAND
jgi:hypothetical protein